MTEAALELHLTQSGISQHVKSLEDFMELKLFDRMKQKIVPTEKAHVLYAEWASAIEKIESGVIRVKGQEEVLAGPVSIGMPNQFGNSIIMPLLIEFGKKHPKVRVDLSVGFAAEMNDLLLSGFLDFAFVDTFAMDKRVQTEDIYEEQIELWISQTEVKKYGTQKNTREFFEQLEYLAYEKGEPILRMWFKHHLGDDQLKLNTRAVVSSPDSMARLIDSGLGAGVIPGHMAPMLKQLGMNLSRFKGSGTPLRNSVRLAQLHGRTHSSTVKYVLEYLRKSLKDIRSKKRTLH